jgi:hypothetical protein
VVYKGILHTFCSFNNLTWVVVLKWEHETHLTY